RLFRAPSWPPTPSLGASTWSSRAPILPSTRPLRASILPSTAPILPSKRPLRASILSPSFAKAISLLSRSDLRSTLMSATSVHRCATSDSRWAILASIEASSDAGSGPILPSGAKCKRVSKHLRRRSCRSEAGFQSETSPITLPPIRLGGAKLPLAAPAHSVPVLLQRAVELEPAEERIWIAVVFENHGLRRPRPRAKARDRTVVALGIVQRQLAAQRVAAVIERHALDDACCFGQRLAIQVDEARGQHLGLDDERRAVPMPERVAHRAMRQIPRIAAAVEKDPAYLVEALV